MLAIEIPVVLDLLIYLVVLGALSVIPLIVWLVVVLASGARRERS